MKPRRRNALDYSSILLWMVLVLVLGANAWGQIDALKSQMQAATEKAAADVKAKRPRLQLQKMIRHPKKNWPTMYLCRPTGARFKNCPRRKNYSPKDASARRCKAWASFSMVPKTISFSAAEPAAFIAA